MNDCPICQTRECKAYAKIWNNLRRPDGYRWLSIHDDMNGITRTEMPSIWETPHVYPPVTTQIANAAKAAVDFVADGFKMVSDEEQTRRLGICKACEFFDAKADRCSKCGCTMLKTRIRSSVCPVGRW